MWGAFRSPKGVHDIHVEWFVITLKHGDEAQPVLA